jgi:hypothetical protein
MLHHGVTPSLRHDTTRHGAVESEWEFHEDKPPGSLVSPALSSFILHVLVLKNQMSLDNIRLVHHHGLQGLL